jgi:hypothetical protein
MFAANETFHTQIAVARRLGRFYRGAAAYLILGIAFMFILSGCTSAPKADTVVGDSAEMGQGAARTYLELDAEDKPVSLGVVFDKGMLEGLPTEPNSTSRCFDGNGNGNFDMHECIGDYEIVLALPQEVAGRADIPFQWVGLNWNPHGHIVPAPPPWSAPHFDFHFYTAKWETIQQIRAGTCGELIDCEDFKRAQLPVPVRYVAPDHIDVGAAVPAMGNHLIDPTSPELVDPNQKFTHTWIYGAYDGHIIFYEPMITRDFLLSQPDVCTSLKIPQAWETSGYYPTKYCIRYFEERGEYKVSLEEFIMRQGDNSEVVQK